MSKNYFRRKYLILTLKNRPSKFGPLNSLTLHQEALESHLAPFRSGGDVNRTRSGEREVEIVQGANELRIGSVSCPIVPAQEPKKVPAPLFYHNNAQDAVLESLLSDWILGEHLLLVGNQGTDRNIIIDQFYRREWNHRENEPWSM